MEFLPVKTSLNCNGSILDLPSPIVMGILNVTPDSFYDGGRFTSDQNILKQVEKMLSEGASLIDIGGMSSRPGAVFVSEKEEIERVIPSIILLKKEFPNALISVDTWRSNVAKASVQNGANLINDISGGQFDEKLFETIGDLNVPFVLMHIKGTPEHMQEKPTYRDVKEEILTYFIEKIERLNFFGVNDIILDVGFGFGKSIEHNYEILKNLHAFNILGLPQLVGVSRKSMIYKTLNIEAKDALSATSVLHFAALKEGAKILRAHDVKEAIETIQLFELLR
jgi:dihydropteroate synthase